ncbi:MAG: sigma-70 family RNA polymerase sigma factor [Eubacterium sp.]|nr:sigma-70 family RNA polymerase sigma factor [Eubacterium sp.]
MSATWNESLLSRWISQYGDSILRMCYLYLKDYQLAEDVTQETFLQAHKKYHTFKHQSNEKTWIMQIAINRCKNCMRTHWFRQASFDTLEETKDEKNHYEFILDKNAITPEIMKLPVKYRDVILLYYYQELTVKEMAFVLNQKESTILQRLKRAREQLKPQLQEVL